MNLNLLDKNEVAKRIGLKPKTAAALMMEMNPIPVCGKVRKRYRVTEANLEKWITENMMKPASNVKSHSTGTKRKFERK